MTKSAIRTLLNGIKALIPPAQVQADYGNNNSNTPSYIKNRPFYRDGSELKQLEEEFVPPISAGNVYFDQDLSDKYNGAANVKEGFNKIVADHFEIYNLSHDSHSISVLGTNETTFLGRSGNNSYLIKSEDGINWEYPNGVTQSLGLDWDSQAKFLDGFWYVHDSYKIFRSEDLVTWEKINFPENAIILGSIYMANGRFYACVKISSPYIITSKDGANWESYAVPFFEDSFSNDIYTFACNDEILILSSGYEIRSCRFDDFNNWASYLLQGSQGNYQLGIVNGVFYHYKWGGFAYLKDPSSLNGWEVYDPEGDSMPEATGPAAYKDGYYLFNSTGDFSSDKLIYTKDFSNFFTYDTYAPGGVYSNKNAIIIGQKIISGPKNELGLVKEKQLEEVFENLDNKSKNNSNAISDINNIINQNSIILKDNINGFNYVLQMQNGNLISHCRYVSLEVTQLPNKSTYELFEEFNPEGMIVTGFSEDGTSSEVMIYDYEKTIPLTNSSTYDLLITTKQGKEELKCYVTLNINNPYVDFICDVSGDEITLIGWRETYQEEPSTKCILPDVEGTIL